MLTTLLALLFFSCQLRGSVMSSAHDGQCDWKKTENSPNVYWINMDKSVDRRVAMEKHLDDVVGPGNHFRVRGFSRDDIYIPADIEESWAFARAMYETAEDIPRKSSVADSSKFKPYKIILSSLFGRKKINNLSEIGCTISHLFAIRQAINDKKNLSKYALIVEDDVQFLFNVDWDSLVASVPKADWGIIQLFNSNKETMDSRWRDYLKKKGGKNHFWMEKSPKSQAGYWSTCAYLINKDVMNPILDQIWTERDGWDDVKLIAGLMNPVVPRNSKCEKNTSGVISYSMDPPCIWSPRGFQADAYIYSMTKSWIFSVPLLANGVGGNQSTFHQDHVVTLHQGAFSRLRVILNTMLAGDVPLPSFVQQACPNKILDEMILQPRTSVMK